MCCMFPHNQQHGLELISSLDLVPGSPGGGTQEDGVRCRELIYQQRWKVFSKTLVDEHQAQTKREIFSAALSQIASQLAP